MNTEMKPPGILTTFGTIPSFAVGYIRDVRVRWALEELGQRYTVRVIDATDQQSPAYRREQPFGQIPCWQDDQVQLFESGAILLYLAQQSDILMPSDPAGRARAVTWAFAALNSVEPKLLAFAEMAFFHSDEEWARARLPQAEAAARKRVADLDAWLAERDYLEDRFSVADIMMASVLRLLDASRILPDYPAANAYLERCLARPAFRRAMQAHVALAAPSQALAPAPVPGGLA